jgi:hypothetical protein
VADADVEEALRLIRANPTRAAFAGPRDPALLAAAEAALGRPLPASYRRFVEELGAGSLGSFEVYGVIDDDFEDSSVPDAIWFTLSEREAGLPGGLVVVGESGDGALVCLDLDDGAAEPPVVLASAAWEERLALAPNFGAYLLDGVRRALGG